MRHSKPASVAGLQGQEWLRDEVRELETTGFCRSCVPWQRQLDLTVTCVGKIEESFKRTLGQDLWGQGAGVTGFNMAALRRTSPGREVGCKGLLGGYSISPS